MKWQRILAPTDRSPFSEKAVTYAHELAKLQGAELHVLRVLDGEHAVTQYALTGVVDVSRQTDDYHRWIAELVGETGDVRRVEAVRAGNDIAEAILRYAAEQNIDLIVMATHGRSGLTHLFLGSVAEQVMRRAACPLLTLRPDTLK